MLELIKEFLKSNYFFAFLGAVLSVVGTLFLFVSLRPRLKITEAYFSNNRLKIKVVNLKRRSAAVRLAIEVAVLNNEYTYHFKVDRAEFISIPSKRDGRKAGTSNERVFQVIGIPESLPMLVDNSEIENEHDLYALLRDENSTLRVRVHAYHSLSGFGRYFQVQFKWGQYLRKIQNKKTITFFCFELCINL